MIQDAPVLWRQAQQHKLHQGVGQAGPICCLSPHAGRVGKAELWVRRRRWRRRRRPWEGSATLNPRPGARKAAVWHPWSLVAHAVSTVSVPETRQPCEVRLTSAGSQLEASPDKPGHSLVVPPQCFVSKTRPQKEEGACACPQGASTASAAAGCAASPGSLVVWPTTWFLPHACWHITEPFLQVWPVQKMQDSRRAPLCSTFRYSCSCGHLAAGQLAPCWPQSSSSSS